MANFGENADFAVERAFIFYEWKRGFDVSLFPGNDFGTVLPFFLFSNERIRNFESIL